MRQSNTILLASTNLDKCIEFKSLLEAEYPSVELVPAQEIIRNADKLSKVEHYETYLENAIAKARAANLASHYPCLADDSGLEVEALGGAPGVRTHRYAIPKAGTTQTQANIQKLLEELKGKSKDQRKARFVCVLALEMEGLVIHSTGTLEGVIGEAPQGSTGFGYDPIFIPAGQNRTLAEMTPEEKNKISHRAKAFNALVVQIRSLRLQFARP